MYFISGLMMNSSATNSEDITDKEYLSFGIGYTELLEQAFKMVSDHKKKLHSAFNYIVIEQYSQGYCPKARNKAYLVWDEYHSDWKEISSNNFKENVQWCFLNNL